MIDVRLTECQALIVVRALIWMKAEGLDNPGLGEARRDPPHHRGHHHTQQGEGRCARSGTNMTVIS